MESNVRLFKAKDLQRYLGISHVKLLHMREKMGLPYLRLGDRNYYDIVVVDEWLKDQTKITCEKQPTLVMNENKNK